MDVSKTNVSNKMSYFSLSYNKLLKDKKDFGTNIKWSRNLKNRFRNGLKEEFSEERIIPFNYRPYFKNYLYHSNLFIDEHGLTDNIFDGKNIAIAITGPSSSKPFQCLAVNSFLSLDFLEKTQCIPLYIIGKNEKIKQNITDWGLEQFKNNYKDKKIKKEDIFHYVYGVLHNPAYRKKYELNLKREFPRIPFYKDFWKWAKWGKELMKLHINYGEEKPFPLKRIDIKTVEKKAKQKEFFPKVKEPEQMFGMKPRIKVKLKADKTAGTIELDDITTLKGIPKEAWEYKLGNRSAIEWILDQYKEKKPKDPTIAEKFNSYRFADHKEEVIELIRKVTTVSMETMAIINRMGNEKE